MAVACLGSRYTPVAMEYPRALLALFAAVLCPATAAALGKLACVLFPAAALVVSALSDAASGVVFPAEVAHNNACPVLHVRCVVPNGELLDEREDVEVVRELILFQLLFFFFGFGCWHFAIQYCQVGSNLKLGNKVGLLEVVPEVAVLRNVRKQLQ